MRLTDLDPHWISGIRSPVPEAEGKRGIIGLSFLCPHCSIQRLAILFDPPIDDDVLWLFATWEPFKGHRWSRTGETFDALTLYPSIDASQHGHWHGSIRNGVIE